MDTKELLNHLAEYQAQRQVILMEKQKLVDSVLTPEIKEKLAEIDEEFSAPLKGVDEYIEAVTQKVKESALAAGATVKGDYLQAVFTKGRVSWDTRALDGYIVSHPELEQFRKVGDPSISIRTVK